MEALLVVVLFGGFWVALRRGQHGRRSRPGQRLEWPGVLPLTSEGRDAYAAEVLRALTEDTEPDLDDLQAAIAIVDHASFEESASPQTHRHHAACLTAFYQRAALAAVLGADPYRADEGSLVDEIMSALDEASAVPARRRALTRRAMANLVEAALLLGRQHGTSRVERLDATLAAFERRVAPP